MIPGGFIALQSRGQLKEPTHETMEILYKMNHLFNAVHGTGAVLRKSNGVLEKTVTFIRRKLPSVRPALIKLFVKTKYCKRIKAQRP